MPPTICETCIGEHIIITLGIPEVCPTCNGSGTCRRIGAPVSVLVRRAEEKWDLAAHDPDKILRVGEEREIYRVAGYLYGAAAKLRAPGTRGRTALAGQMYHCMDAADYRTEGRQILRALGYGAEKRRDLITMEAAKGVM